MINSSAILNTLPTATEPTTDLTIMSIGPASVERKDMSAGMNVGATLTTQKETKNNVSRRMVKVVHPFVGEDPILAIPVMYNVTAHLVITSDDRFAKIADLSATLAELLNWCLQEEETGVSGVNVLRLAQGEL